MSRSTRDLQAVWKGERWRSPWRRGFFLCSGWGVEECVGESRGVEVWVQLSRWVFVELESNVEEFEEVIVDDGDM